MIIQYTQFPVLLHSISVRSGSLYLWKSSGIDWWLSIDLEIDNRPQIIVPATLLTICKMPIYTRITGKTIEYKINIWSLSKQRRAQTTNRDETSNIKSQGNGHMASLECHTNKSKLKNEWKERTRNGGDWVHIKSLKSNVLAHIGMRQQYEYDHVHNFCITTTQIRHHRDRSYSCPFAKESHFQHMTHALSSYKLDHNKTNNHFIKSLPSPSTVPSFMD